MLTVASLLFFIIFYNLVCVLLLLATSNYNRDRVCVLLLLPPSKYDRRINSADRDQGEKCPPRNVLIGRSKSIYLNK